MQLNQDALERQVAEVVLGPKHGSAQGVTCPVSVEVKVGNEIDCRVWDGSNPKDVQVKVISDQGGLLVEALH
ncbi:DUF4333 domain-containing protein [Streptomyces sp. NPDC059262]|uniref:DUF4333 domain-containing protein n=1 Tax=Streptomyces sp. NPDC059262 TaxID=3346797 RepID=UPI0036BE535D